MTNPKEIFLISIEDLISLYPRNEVLRKQLRPMQNQLKHIASLISDRDYEKYYFYGMTDNIAGMSITLQIQSLPGETEFYAQLTRLRFRRRFELVSNNPANLPESIQDYFKNRTYPIS